MKQGCISLNDFPRYNKLNDYLLARFGRKVYKLAIDAGFTCPTRDGTLGTGGCIFCSQAGSGDFAESGQDVREQLKSARERIENKLPEGAGFISYFQSFTNTYAPTEKLREMYYAVIEDPDVVALSVATRPDCISESCLALLAESNRTKPVFVELGLQTSNEKTAEYINRCYKNEVFSEAVSRLRREGIEVIVHMILGLPGETVSDMVNTAKFVSDHDVQGVKLQLLHVLKNTRLAETDYEPMEMEKYFFCLGECLEHIRSDIVIHRLTGDGDKKILIAPLWSGDKHAVLNGFAKYMEEHDIVQGKKSSSD